MNNYSDSKQRYTYYGIRTDEAALPPSATPEAILAVAADYSTMGNYLDCVDRVAVLNAKANSIVEDKYAKASMLIGEGKCAEAESILSSFGTYGNEQITAYYYAIAEKYLAQGEWDAASAAFKKAGKYSDAANRINEPYYRQGEALLATNDEAGAIFAFKKAGAYSNASDR